MSPAIAEQDRAYPVGWFLGRCPDCRKILTRYDYSLEEAQRFAQEDLDSGAHICKGSK
jgi:hypothetical protein